MTVQGPVENHQSKMSHTGYAAFEPERGECTLLNKAMLLNLLDMLGAGSVV